MFAFLPMTSSSTSMKWERQIRLLFLNIVDDWTIFRNDQDDAPKTLITSSMKVKSATYRRCCTSIVSPLKIFLVKK